MGPKAFRFPKPSRPVETRGGDGNALELEEGFGQGSSDPPPPYKTVGLARGFSFTGPRKILSDPDGANGSFLIAAEDDTLAAKNVPEAALGKVSSSDADAGEDGVREGGGGASVVIMPAHNDFVVQKQPRHPEEMACHPAKVDSLEAHERESRTPSRVTSSSSSLPGVPAAASPAPVHKQSIPDPFIHHIMDKRGVHVAEKVLKSRQLLSHTVGHKPIPPDSPH